MELNSFSKSLWQEHQKKNFKFFCPLCSSPRETSMHPKPHQPILVFRVFVTSLAVMLCTWNWMGWKGIVSFIPLWIAFEWTYRSKVRLQVECPHCGFDPYLYVSRPEAANARVKEHFKKVFDERGIPYPPVSKRTASKKRPPPLNL